MAKFPWFRQLDSAACGPTCLKMICKFYGKNIDAELLTESAETKKDGSTMLAISRTAEKLGFRTCGIKISLDDLQTSSSFPCIVHWNQSHFVVLYKIREDVFYIADPLYGLLTYKKDEFKAHWLGVERELGAVLLLEVTPSFYQNEALVSRKNPIQNIKILVVYFLKYRGLIGQLFLGLMTGSLLQLVFPILTQSMIDIGIQNQDIQFIYLILISQFVLFFGRMSVDVMRNYIFMHMSSRINISLVSDFISKLMKLPINYFDTKMTGDIIQRLSDTRRIESFFTNSSLSTLFSIFNFIVFSFVIAIYSSKIFIVFVIGSAMYFTWIVFFLKRRADLDYKKFHQNSAAQSKLIELITGMTEIKLHTAERRLRGQWEAIQLKSFKLNLKGLTLSTVQSTGSSIINESKNIFITFLCAKQVVDGNITLGMMLSISYIIGQLNAPVFEVVNFIQKWQDAKLSLERLGEIYGRKEEESGVDPRNSSLAKCDSIVLSDISFKYVGSENSSIFENLNLIIPSRKVTALVGRSGSGKTTLMKLLLKFWEPGSGNIKIGNKLLSEVSASHWRDRCGVVMQEGFIFNDTIANNIALGSDEVDESRVWNAARVACIDEFIGTLPHGINTKIGMEGLNISTGQKQRILIARAVYKDPEYILLDEATSSLDANTERKIIENLDKFFIGRTVLVIAHRLSTVKNADQIIVLEGGNAIEIGTHQQLVRNKGPYFQLVKNQLELDN